MKNKTNLVEQPLANYIKGEDDLLRIALCSSYNDRFHTIARLMKMNIMLKSAKVIHEKLIKMNVLINTFRHGKFISASLML